MMTQEQRSAKMYLEGLQQVRAHVVASGTAPSVEALNIDVFEAWLNAMPWTEDDVRAAIAHLQEMEGFGEIAEWFAEHGVELLPGEES